jgi:hypothetical protein
MTDIINAYGEDTERMNKVNDFLEENKLTKMTQDFIEMGDGGGSTWEEGGD